MLPDETLRWERVHKAVSTEYDGDACRPEYGLTPQAIAGKVLEWHADFAACFCPVCVLARALTNLQDVQKLEESYSAWKALATDRALQVSECEATVTKLRTLLGELLDQFTERGHPGIPCLQVKEWRTRFNNLV